ncbi:MAG TPA: NAD-dependent deacylase [Acetobacteraceae bacterium]|nr:NAD-dependent deacylase [Acetobacteraceae bacterium]
MKSIVILTGAGISRESGLATFRDPDGIWARVRIEDVATPEAFRRDPARVQAFYNTRRAALRDPALRPNAAHLALARLEREYPGDVLIVTQNVDNLHEAAGSHAVLHMHGALNEAACMACAAIVPWHNDIEPNSTCPGCGSHALRPNVVWFGEMPFHMEKIEEALEECGIFAAVGTSGQVYPAAGFINAVAGRARTFELTLEPSALSPLFGSVRYGPATATVPLFVDELLRG